MTCEYYKENAETKNMQKCVLTSTVDERFLCLLFRHVITPICAIAKASAQNVEKKDILKFNDGLHLLPCLLDGQTMKHKYCNEKNSYDTLANKYGGSVVKAKKIKQALKKTVCRARRKFVPSNHTLTVQCDVLN